MDWAKTDNSRLISESGESSSIVNDDDDTNDDTYDDDYDDDNDDNDDNGDDADDDDDVDDKQFKADVWIRRTFNHCPSTILESQSRKSDLTIDNYSKLILAWLIS